MAEGLTFETKQEANEMVKFLAMSGKEATVRKLMPNVFKVYYVTKTGLKAEQEDFELGEGIGGTDFLTEQEEIQAGITRGRRKRTIEDTLEKEFRKEDTTRELQRAKRHKKTQLVLDKDERILKQKQEELKKIIALRERTGHTDPGEVVPVFHPTSKVIIDYKIETRGTKQRLKEYTEKGIRQKGREIISDIGETPVVVGEFVSGIGGSLSKQINVKRGMRESIPGQAPMPKAVIAALPQKTEGMIGTERPSIADTSSSKSLGAGFASMPGLKNPSIKSVLKPKRFKTEKEE